MFEIKGKQLAVFSAALTSAYAHGARRVEVSNAGSSVVVGAEYAAGKTVTTTIGPRGAVDLALTGAGVE